MKDTVEIVFQEPLIEGKGLLPTLSGVGRKLRSFRKEALAESLAGLTEDVAGILQIARERTSLGGLETISVAAEVSAEGGLSWVGQLAAGSAASITLTFRVDGTARTQVQVGSRYAQEADRVPR